MRMALSEKNRKYLEQVIEDNHFAHAAEYLQRTAKQTIKLSCAGRETYQAVGNSRAAGEPDLPENAEWPLDSSGIPMTFVLQLNLNELAGLDPEKRLPAEGVLFFFAGDYDSVVEHKVLHASPQQMDRAARKSAPAPTLHEREDGAYRPHRLSARAAIDLPGYAYVDNDEIEDEDHGWDEYEELGFALEGDKPFTTARMFGYAEGQHGDDEYMAALELFGCESTYDPNEAIDRLTEVFGGDRERAEREVANIVMLAEIDSDQDIGFQWGDSGVLHYFMRKEDLSNGNFERTTCSFYSS